MKEISELNLPENIRYTKDHEWARLEKDVIRVGINDYAQDQLGEIVYVELPGVGDSFEKGSEFGTVESVKAVSELFTPISGEVAAVNNDLEDSPELVNNAPYDKGWMIEIKPGNSAEFETLLNKDDYLHQLKAGE